jgi:hypothetical protein
MRKRKLIDLGCRNQDRNKNTNFLAWSNLFKPTFRRIRVRIEQLFKAKIRIRISKKVSSSE